MGTPDAVQDKLDPRSGKPRRACGARGLDCGRSHEVRAGGLNKAIGQPVG